MPIDWDKVRVGDVLLVDSYSPEDGHLLVVEFIEKDDMY